MTELTMEALAVQGYFCSACLKPADKCKCPWREIHGIEQRPMLVPQSELQQAGA